MYNIAVPRMSSPLNMKLFAMERMRKKIEAEQSAKRREEEDRIAAEKRVEEHAAAESDRARREAIFYLFKGRQSYRILEAVAEKNAITVDHMLSRSRKRKLTRARHEACYELSTRTNLSLPQMARVMKMLDHTSVYHGVLAHAVRNNLPMPRKFKDNAGRLLYYKFSKERALAAVSAVGAVL